VVAEALAVIAEDGAQALTMRTLVARLGVVPGALYRHVRNKEQLQDLVLDGVLAEVDREVDRSLPWTEQVKLLAQRLRAVLEDHPGVAGLLKRRDPLGPHSLVLAEAFLSPLHAAGFGDHQAGLAYFPLVDYTIGFAVATTHTSVNEQRVRDAATRNQLHEFFRTLPADRFPALAALGEHVWLDTATSASPPASTPSSTASTGHGARQAGGPTPGDPPPSPHDVQLLSTRWTNDPLRHDRQLGEHRPATTR
jgi:AcrR family transcriptional regulator